MKWILFAVVVAFVLAMGGVAEAQNCVCGSGVGFRSLNLGTPTVPIPNSPLNFDVVDPLQIVTPTVSALDGGVYSFQITSLDAGRMITGIRMNVAVEVRDAVASVFAGNCGSFGVVPGPDAALLGVSLGAQGCENESLAGPMSRVHFTFDILFANPIVGPILVGSPVTFHPVQLILLADAGNPGPQLLGLGTNDPTYIVLNRPGSSTALNLGFVDGGEFFLMSGAVGGATYTWNKFHRDDPNGDGAVNIVDPVYILTYLNGGNSPPCLEALDSNDDNAVDISDAVYFLDYLYGYPINLPPSTPRSINPGVPGLEVSECGGDTFPHAGISCDESIGLCP